MLSKGEYTLIYKFGGLRTISDMPLEALDTYVIDNSIEVYWIIKGFISCMILLKSLNEVNEYLINNKEIIKSNYI